MKELLFIGILVLTSCSFKKNPLSNQTHKGHQELYSEPDAPKAAEEEAGKRIVIAATSDIEGHFHPHLVKFKDEHNPKTQTMKIGGADAMKAYFDVLREQYKHVLLVDAGDILSTATPMKDIRNFYEKNKYDAVTIGLSDFNLRLPKGTSSSMELFRNFAKLSPVPLVLSNLYELKTARSVEWKGTFPYLIKDVGGVKVGIIGLVPDDIVELTPVDNRVGLFVENMIQNTLRQARLLRSLGANVIVVMTHQGVRCGQELAQAAKLPLAKVNFEPTKAGVCDLSKDLGTYLERLPPHLVDVVIGGRINEKMANFVNETLVLGSYEHGKSMIYAELFVDPKSKKLLKEKTVVHQPVLFCREFFKETDDCYTGDPTVDHAKRVPAKFLGKELNLLEPEKTVSQIGSRQRDHIKAIEELGAHLAYVPATSGNSKMMLLSLSGTELIDLLEEDFNLSSTADWHPSPFKQEKDFLKLIIKGETVKADEDYKILADLEAIQQKRVLKAKILGPASVTLNEHSWSEFEALDDVSTTMASLKR